ncbi:conserved hypothetical protein [Roseibium sp. TrichSKD4]|nr:conserved hypothetical protein [Roseibium sp. TrichSKD4]
MLRQRKPPKGMRTASGRKSRSKEAQKQVEGDVRANNLKARQRMFGCSYVQGANPEVVSNLRLLRQFMTAHNHTLTGSQVAAVEFIERSYQAYARAVQSPAAIYGAGEGLFCLAPGSRS